MKQSEFQETMIKLVERFIRKWKPVNIQCPLIIQEHRQHNYRSKTCETCRWRSDLGKNSMFAYDEKSVRGWHCRGLGYEHWVTNETPACPKYED